MATEQVKSRARVAAHGEVFTAEREVKAMCDLVKSETERIESRFLEPACGTGNFLAEILSRKLAVVESRYGKSLYEYEKYSIVALSSLYGVELLPDNASECRERLFVIWDRAYTAKLRKKASLACREAAKYILDKNILCGDALTLLANDGSPLVFAEWSLVTGRMVKRRDFALGCLLASGNKPASGHAASATPSLLDYDASLEKREMTNRIPLPIREYPLTDYSQVQNHA